MITKMFEIRDAGTLIPVVATLMASHDAQEHWLVRRAGFSGDDGLVFIGKIETGGGQYDPHSWPGGARTMTVAHAYIQKAWGNLSSGDVIDVQFILGETTQRKTSERQQQP
jgi:hypothetical protein